MAVTDQNLHNEIQMTLLETPNSGASYGSGLYTVAEIAARMNYRLDLFNKLTNITTTVYTTNVATTTSKNQDLSTATPDLIDLIGVFYSTDLGVTWYSIPRGSAFEGDVYSTTNTTTGNPAFYAIDVSSVLNIAFFPTPTTANQMNLIYVPRIGTLPSTPNGTAINMPDDFTPFVKYGVLADLFKKSGETYDPLRAQVCESLFMLGVETAKDWVSSSSAQATSTL